MLVTGDVSPLLLLLLLLLLLHLQRERELFGLVVAVFRPVALLSYSTQPPLPFPIGASRIRGCCGCLRWSLGGCAGRVGGATPTGGATSRRRTRRRSGCCW
jgi:hypothetical protein